MWIRGNVLALLFLAAAFRYGTIFVPSGCSDPLKMKLLLVGIRFSRDVTYVLERLGVSSSVEMLKKLAKLNDADVSSDSELNMSEATISGVTVLIYEPKTLANSELRSAIVYLHGGGFVYGSPAWVHPFTRYLALESSAVVVSVDYRLAPQHVFPAAFDDCVAVVRRLLDGGERELRIDPAKVAVAGDSAGGNLAAAVSQALRLEKRRPVVQILVYPVLQLLSCNTTSYRRYAHDDLLSREDTAKFKLYYLAGNLRHLHSVLSETVASPSAKKRLRTYMADYLAAPEAPRDDGEHDAAAWRDLGDKLLSERASPLLARSLDGVPPSYVLTAEIDVLRSEGESYVKRLRAAGVTVEFREVANQRHGFLMLPDWHHGVRNIVADMARFFQKHTEGPAGVA